MSERRVFCVQPTAGQPSTASEGDYETEAGRYDAFATREAASGHYRVSNQGQSSADAGPVKQQFNRLFAQSDAPPAKNDAPDLAETRAFDHAVRGLGRMGSDQYQRLPHNRTVTIDLARGERMELWLASYRYVLQLAKSSLQLIDAKGKMHLVFAGTSTVGRRGNNDLVTERDMGDISREHLIIDWEGGESVRLTDLSSLGTFVPPDKLVS